MNTKLTSRFAFALAVLALASVGFAQTAMVSTTLPAALNTSATNFTVTSATGIVNSSNPLSSSEIGNPSNTRFTLLVIDKEAMAVRTVSGTTVSVIRGFDGTTQSPHASGAKIWVGPSNAFGNAGYGPGGGEPVGACSRANLPYLPKVFPQSGRAYDCTATPGIWVSFPGYGQQAVIASATTIAPVAPVFHVSGTTGIATITVPPACPGNCSITIIPDGILTTTTAGNIAIASTTVVSKALIYTYDSGTSKWYPSY